MFYKTKDKTQNFDFSFSILLPIPVFGQSTSTSCNHIKPKCYKNSDINMNIVFITANINNWCLILVQWKYKDLPAICLIICSTHLSVWESVWKCRYNFGCIRGVCCWQQWDWTKTGNAMENQNWGLKKVNSHVSTLMLTGPVVFVGTKDCS